MYYSEDTHNTTRKSNITIKVTNIPEMSGMSHIKLTGMCKSKIDLFQMILITHSQPLIEEDKKSVALSQLESFI